MSFRWLGLGLLLLVSVGLMAWYANRLPPPAASPSMDTALIEAFDQLSGQAQAALANHRDLSPMLDKIQAMIQRVPTFWPARRLATLLLMQQGKNDQAYAQALKVIELEPTQPEMMSIAGLLALKQGHLPQAQQHFASAAALEPDNVRFRLQYAQSLLADEQLQAAQRQIEKALEIDSSQCRAYAMRAAVYVRQNRLKDAIASIRQAIDLTPAKQANDRVIYTRQYARLLRQTHEPARSLAVLHTLSLDQQFDPQVMVELAQCWSMLHQPILAARHYEQAVLRNPADRDAAALAAQWYERSGSTDKARQMRRQMRKIGPDTP